MVKNITNFKQKSRGFTIVELLVVIVVIGILATITIVSYTGITQKANTTKALSNAQSAQNVAEVFASQFNYYPMLTADFINGKPAGATDNAINKLPAGIYLTNVTPGSGNNATPSNTNGATTVFYQYCGAVAAPTSGNATGGRIQYWDFSTGALSTNVIYVGTGASGLGAGTGTVCNTWVTPAT